MKSKAVDQKVFQTTSSRQWIRLIMVYLFVPLVLLVCGGDFGWWQAWVYALLISAAGVGGRILGERRHPGLTAERQSGESIQGAKAWDKVLAPLMAISISFPLVIVAGLDHRYGWSLAFPLWLNIIGFILIAVGYAFGVWAFIENRFFSSVVRIQTERGHVVCDTGPYRIVRHPGYAGNILPLLGIFLTALGYAISAWAFIENRFFSSVVRIQKDRGHAVCDSGPYRIVRHPGYAGNVLPLPGIALALSSLWTLIPAALALVIIVIRTALEDRTLQEELPGYQEYARRVRYRLFPGIY